MVVPTIYAILYGLERVEYAEAPAPIPAPASLPEADNLQLDLRGGGMDRIKLMKE